MAHAHSVYDTDVSFKIDTKTKAIKKGSSMRTKLVQGDHNSEKFTFTLNSRHVEGHDMTLCNRVELHYINTDIETRCRTSKNFAVLDDLTVDLDTDNVTCSWMVTRGATKYAGLLQFLLTFKCIDDSGEEVYSWSTTWFTGMQVLPGGDNSDYVLEEYNDAFEQLRQDVLDAAEKTSEEIKAAVREELAENPPMAGATAEEAAQIEQNKTDIAALDRTKLAASELPNAVNEALAQAKASGVFDGADGKDGKDGVDGQPGKDGTNGKDGADGQPGADGKDYVLTEADKQEIAELVEVPGAVKTVNGIAPDESGNVEIAGSDFGQNVTITGATDINIKKWRHKKIVIDGSSITAGGTGNTVPVWGSFLKDIFALDAVYNHAVSGTGWFFGGNSYVVDRVDAYEADADAVILMGDYNGIYAYTSNVGTIADEAAADGSYYAKLKCLAEKLISKYPLCPVIWVVEPPRASVGETNGEKIPMAYDSIYALQSKIIEEVAELYGFPHCNLMKNTVFRPWIRANYDATTSDGTHPWNNIQRTMAQVIAETMKRTPLIYNESYVVNPDDSSGDDTGGEPGSGGNTGGETEVTVTSIKATFTQGDAIIKTTDELEVLKDYLKVVAVYSDLSEAIVTDYTLSGELTEGTSTITVTYGTVSTTFEVTVTFDNGSVTVALGDVIDESLIGKFFAQNTGNVTAREGMRISQYLTVKGGTTITLSAGISLPNLTNKDIRFYDADGSVITDGDINLVYGAITASVPENASSFRIAFDDDDDAKTITYFRA